MPPKKKVHETQRWQPKAQPDSSWMLHTAERLEQRAAQQPPPEAVPAAVAFAAAARLARQRQQQSRGGVWAPPDDVDMEGEDEEVDAETLMISQREYYRTGGGMTATTFEPQRNTYFVCGRPVQVSCCLLIDEPCFGCSAHV